MVIKENLNATQHEHRTNALGRRVTNDTVSDTAASLMQRTTEILTARAHRAFTDSGLRNSTFNAAEINLYRNYTMRYD